MIPVTMGKGKKEKDITTSGAEVSKSMNKLSANVRWFL